jgi:hypothetical protein
MFTPDQVGELIYHVYFKKDIWYIPHLDLNISRRITEEDCQLNDYFAAGII